MSKSGRGWVREYTSGGATGVDFTTPDVAGLSVALPNWFELPSGGTLVGVDADGTAVTLSNLPANQRYEVTLRSITTSSGTIRIGYSEEVQQSTGVAGPAGPDFTVTPVKTSAYGPVAGELVQVDTTGGAVTVTLPTAVGISGKRIRVQDQSGAAPTNAITVATTSAQTVNGSATIAKITTAFGQATYVSDGANWITEGPSRVSVTAAKTGTAYVARAGDLVLCDTTAAVTITLPTAVGIKGQSIRIKDITDASVHNITVAVTSAQTIDATTPTAITTAKGTRSYTSDGANWWIT